MRMTSKASGERDDRNCGRRSRSRFRSCSCSSASWRWAWSTRSWSGASSARVLAAVALGNLYFFNVTIFGVGHADGARSDRRAGGRRRRLGGGRAPMQRGLIIALGCSSVVTALLLAPAAPVLRALHQPPEIIADAAAYAAHLDRRRRCRILAFVVLRQSLQAMHRVAPIVWTMIVANLTNAGFNWVFVYGHLGSPALGVAGSAIATAISRWVMSSCCCSRRVA